MSTSQFTTPIIRWRVERVVAIALMEDRLNALSAKGYAIFAILPTKDNSDLTQHWEVVAWKAQ